MGKPFWQSKVFWVNVFGIIAMVGTGHFGSVDWVALEAPFLGVVNIVLRFVTDQPVTLS